MSWGSSEYWDMLIRRSLSRFFMLRALYEQPSHGYRLKEAVKKAAQGCCDPTDAMIYPAIKELVSSGYVEVRMENQGARERKICSLTPKGLDAYKAAAAAWSTTSGSSSTLYPTHGNVSHCKVYLKPMTA